MFEPTESDTDLTRRSQVEDLLRRHRVRPDKRLGQNFLVDRRALEAVVEAADLDPDDTVLEIGAGLGTLTRRLGDGAGRVVAVEYDRRLKPILLETTADLSQVELVFDDVLRLDLASLVRPPFLVVANIPYQITSHLIRRLLELPAPPNRIVLTVQREVAERVVAAPGRMNLLALGVQAYGTPEIRGRLPASAFYPSPRVESAILRVDLHRPARRAPAEVRPVFRLARAGFSQPRKKLRNSLAAGMHLAPAEVDRRLTALGVAPSARAQDLSLEDWERLADGWDFEEPGVD